MENSHWDDSIRRALENFRADDGMNHWDKMESMLNDPANADLNESAEDQILREKLGEVKPEMPVGHWALMEAQLTGIDIDAEEELEDMMLDGKAYESLNNLKAPYNKQHWPIMEEKLVEAFSWRKRAVRYKIAELAILLLAFVTILQYWPEAKQMLPKLNKHKHVPAATAPVADIPSASENQPIADLSNNFQVEEPVTFENQDTDADIDYHLITHADGMPDTENSSPISQSEGASGNIIENKNESELAESSNSIADVSDLDFLSHESRKKLEAVPTIPHLNFGLLATKELPENSRKLQLSKLLGNSSFRMGMYGMSSYDAMEEMQGEEVVLSDTESATIGYGTGLSLAFKNGRWELESGIGYLSKSVKPNNPNLREVQVSLNRREVSGTVWTETQYDMINIPVHVRFDMLDRPKWKMYLQSGMSMNINQNIIYRYDQVYLGTGPSANLAPGEQEDRANAFDAKDVTKNVGTAQESFSASNTFFNFDVGFGLERALNKRYATFLQTRYSHRLGEAGSVGLEEESAVFRSLQLKAGLKVSLFNQKK